MERNGHTHLLAVPTLHLLANILHYVTYQFIPNMWALTGAWTWSFMSSSKKPKNIDCLSRKLLARMHSHFKTTWLQKHGIKCRPNVGSKTQIYCCCFFCHSCIAKRRALLGINWWCAKLRYVMGDILCPLWIQSFIASPSYVNPSEAMCGSRMISWNNAIMQCYISRNRKYSTNAGGCDYDADHLLERKYNLLAVAELWELYVIKLW